MTTELGEKKIKKMLAVAIWTEMGFRGGIEFYEKIVEDVYPELTRIILTTNPGVT